MTRKDLRIVGTSGHPQETVIRSMQRTFLVCAWSDFVDEEEFRKKHDRAYPMGCELMDYLPDICEEFERESYRLACVLYGRIYGKWGCEPWLALNYTCEQRGWSKNKTFVDWGHYAVMEALGHGVAWSDDHDPVLWSRIVGEPIELERVGRLGIYHDGFYWRSKRGQPWKR